MAAWHDPSFPRLGRLETAPLVRLVRQVRIRARITGSLGEPALLNAGRPARPYRGPRRDPSRVLFSRIGRGEGSRRMPRIKAMLSEGKVVRVFGSGQLLSPKLIEIIGEHGEFDAL